MGHRILSIVIKQKVLLNICFVKLSHQFSLEPLSLNIIIYTEFYEKLIFEQCCLQCNYIGVEFINPELFNFNTQTSTGIDADASKEKTSPGYFNRNLV